jgi:hydrogenase-4 component E
VTFSLLEYLAIASCLTAILMAGASDLRLNLLYYSLQTFLLAGLTAALAPILNESWLLLLAILLAAVKGISVPIFLNWIRRKIGVNKDIGVMLATPLSMHLCVLLLGASYLFTKTLPLAPFEGRSWPTATAAVSLVFTGLVIMLTRRIAISQIIGFLVLENGIYLFALTQTSGMPTLVEVGILLDLLAGVMVAGLLIFNIQKALSILM